MHKYAVTMADNKNKERITITIDKDLLLWLDKKVESKIFANRSHGLEYLIKRKMEDENDANE